MNYLTSSDQVLKQKTRQRIFKFLSILIMPAMVFQLSGFGFVMSANAAQAAELTEPVEKPSEVVDQVSTVVTVSSPTVCPNPITIDFDDLPAGTIVTNQYAAQGVNFHATDSDTDALIIFDTENPTGGDTDLITPGYHPTNTQPLYEALVIAENVTDADGDGLVDVPNDEGSGGIIHAVFAEPTEVNSLEVLDIDIGEDTGEVRAYNAGGGLISTDAILDLGDNSYQVVTINQIGVKRLEIELTASGAVPSFEFCEPETPPELGNLRVKKYFDNDGDGTRDGSDDWLANWHFVVRDDQNQIVAEGDTNGNGIFEVNDLEVGTYTVTEILPSGWENTTGGITQQVTVIVNDTVEELFGNRRLPAGFPELVSIGGTCSDQFGNAVVAAGVGIMGSNTGTIQDFNVPGPVVSAYLFWGGRDDDTGDANITFNGTPLVGVESREGWDPIAYYAEVTSYVLTGINDYTIAGLNLDTNNGAGLHVFYQDATANPASVSLKGGLDFAYYSYNYSPMGPDTEVHSFTFDSAPIERTATLNLSVGGSDIQRYRGDNLYVMTGTGSPPANIIGAGGTQILTNFLTHADGAEWDTEIVDVTIPANTTYFAFQIESPENDNGESLSLIAASFMVPEVCGDITVNKKLDADGNGTFESGNDESNQIGFRWLLDDQINGRLMGSTAQVSIGPHQVMENINDLTDFHFVGWYIESPKTEYSCTNPQGVSLPIDLNVGPNQNVEVTICNARDTGDLIVHKLLDSDDDGVIDQTDPDGWYWNIAGGEQDIPMGESRELITDTYSISEFPQNPNYNSSWICYSGDQMIGEGVGTELEVELTTEGAECWFSNVRKLIEVNFDKVIVGGGPSTDLDWEFTLVGTGWTFRDGDVVILPTNNQYPITESSIFSSLYELTGASGICELVEGEIRLFTGEQGGTCVVENTYVGVSISGAKWSDINANGNWDEGEAGLEGWTINLWNDVDGAPGAIIASTVTDLNGEYLFTELVPGTYWVNEAMKNGWIQTSTPEVIGPIAIDSGEMNENNNFGNFKLGSIAGSKWNDVNGDGIWDEGEAGLEGWTINLWNDVDSAPGVIIASTVTDADGAYEFVNLEFGTYWINETMQDGWTQTSTPEVIGPITIISALNVTNQNFGNQGTLKPLLTIEKTVAVTILVNPGNTVTYLVVVKNVGNATAINVVVDDILPKGLVFADTGLQTSSFPIGDLEPDQSKTITYDVIVGSDVLTGVYDNIARASSDNTDPVEDDAEIQVKVPEVLGVEGEPILILTKAVNKELTNPGDTLVYTIVIGNTGTAVAENVRLVDVLPEGFIYADTGLKERVWTLGDMDIDVQHTLTYEVLVGNNVTAGDYENIVEATSDNHDPLQAKAKVLVKIPEVLGAATLADTGFSLKDLAVALAGIMFLMTGFIVLYVNDRFRLPLNRKIK